MDSRDSDSEGESCDESCSDFCSTLQSRIDCLMDLVPTMEQSLAHTQALGMVPATGIPFTVSEAARPFVLNVLDKFPLADSKLIERLGESNWQRYETIRATMDQITKHTVFGKEPPQSIFTPYSVFHDSGMGTSMASASHYAASVASHTSFISSQVEEGNSTMRVPPTPPEVAINEPFECFLCGHELFKIRNRVDWKWVKLQTRHGILLNHQYRLHVFADLQPYICTFESCKSEMVKFPTRKLWSEHEFSEHRHSSIWHCPLCSTVFHSSRDFEDHLSIDHTYSATSMSFHLMLNAAETTKIEPIEEQPCPLCKVIPRKSRRDFAKHVGRHMETIALAALPRASGDDSDESSLDSVADSYTSVRLENGLLEQGDSGCQDSNSPPKLCTDTLRSSLACLTETSPVEESKEGGRCPNPDCNKFFKNLPAHVLTHLSERPFKCPISTCEYHQIGFARKYDQSRHTLTHFKGTMVCGFCPGVGPAAEKSFNRADVFKRHLTSVHGVERSRPHNHRKITPNESLIDVSNTCSTCLETFQNPQEFYDHLDGCLLRFISPLFEEGEEEYLIPPISPPQRPKKPLQGDPDGTASGFSSEDRTQEDALKNHPIISSEQSNILSIHNPEPTTKTSLEESKFPYSSIWHANVPLAQQSSYLLTPSTSGRSHSSISYQPTPSTLYPLVPGTPEEELSQQETFKTWPDEYDEQLIHQDE